MEFYYNFEVNNISLYTEIEVGYHIFKNNFLFLLYTIGQLSEPNMLNLLSSASRTIFQCISGLFITDFANESLSFLFFALTKYFLQELIEQFQMKLMEKIFH